LQLKRKKGLFLILLRPQLHNKVSSLCHIRAMKSRLGIFCFKSCLPVVVKKDFVISSPSSPASENIRKDLKINSKPVEISNDVCPEEPMEIKEEAEELQFVPSKKPKSQRELQVGDINFNNSSDFRTQKSCTVSNFRFITLSCALGHGEAIIWSFRHVSGYPFS